jgi:hypothetical protein
LSVLVAYAVDLLNKKLEGFFKAKGQKTVR